MVENTKIQWAHHTFNPWLGCTKVSPACAFCYAEAWAKRAGRSDLWQGGRKRTVDENWRGVLKWQRRAAATGQRERVFGPSLGDPFDNKVPAPWRDDYWTVIRSCPDLDFLLLTKRPQNIADMLPSDWGMGWPNVWLGITAENDTEMRRRMGPFLDVPAVVHFLSCEPLLSGLPGLPSWLPQIDWVIAGGESGGRARPTHPGWFRELRDQCAAEAVPFFFKQHGEWACLNDAPGGADKPQHVFPDGVAVHRAGVDTAGDTLDGVRHIVWPTPRFQPGLMRAAAAVALTPGSQADLRP